ncbi:hypothetical protein NC652_018184 [Populus alba x Populus x berolinensis]|nr:hypothetical protein NC652_018184 [Populus alba x Populus x berolinensis]
MGAGREVSISLDGVRDKNVMQLKKLNTALFPVRYNDKYYARCPRFWRFHQASADHVLMYVKMRNEKIIKKQPNSSDLRAYYSDICVGSIACRLEKKEGGGLRVYIIDIRCFSTISRPRHWYKVVESCY